MRRKERGEVQKDPGVESCARGVGRQAESEVGGKAWKMASGEISIILISAD